jgi:hypothetical protein
MINGSRGPTSDIDSPAQHDNAWGNRSRGKRRTVTVRTITCPRVSDQSIADDASLLSPSLFTTTTMVRAVECQQPILHNNFLSLAGYY